MRSDRKLYGLEASLAYCRVFLDTIEGEDKGNVYTNEIVLKLTRWAETNIENISYLSGVKIGKCDGNSVVRTHLGNTKPA